MYTNSVGAAVLYLTVTDFEHKTHHKLSESTSHDNDSDSIVNSHRKWGMKWQATHQAKSTKD